MSLRTRRVQYLPFLHHHGLCSSACCEEHSLSVRWIHWPVWGHVIQVTVARWATCHLHLCWGPGTSKASWYIILQNQRALAVYWENFREFTLECWGLSRSLWYEDITISWCFGRQFWKELSHNIKYISVQEVNALCLTPAPSWKKNKKRKTITTKRFYLSSKIFYLILACFRTGIQRPQDLTQ